MIGTSVAAWLVVALWLDRESRLAALWGMLGPLTVAAGSWWLIERTYRRSPGRVTSLMMGAFVVKMVFFGGYVAVMLRGLSLRPVPFVASFTGYFIGLYIVEALYLRRLFAGGFTPPDCRPGL